VLFDNKGGAPLPHNLPPQKPSVRISSDSDIMQKMLNFTHQIVVQYMTFTSSSIERVEYVAMIARASHLEVKVKVEHNLSPQKPSVCTSSDSDIRQQILNFTHQSAVTNPSGDPQVRNIPTRRFSCRIMEPTHQVRENPHSFFDMKPTTMVRKKPPFARTFDMQLKEKEHYSDPTFVRTIHFSLPMGTMRKTYYTVSHVGKRPR